MSDQQDAATLAKILEAVGLLEDRAVNAHEAMRQIFGAQSVILERVFQAHGRAGQLNLLSDLLAAMSKQYCVEIVLKVDLEGGLALTPAAAQAAQHGRTH